MAHKFGKTEYITKRVADITNLTQTDCKRILDSYTDEFVNCFLETGKVNIPRLGSLTKDKYGYHFYPANYLMKERIEKNDN